MAVTELAFEDELLIKKPTALSSKLLEKAINIRQKELGAHTFNTNVDAEIMEAIFDAIILQPNIIRMANEMFGNNTQERIFSKWRIGAKKMSSKQVELLAKLEQANKNVRDSSLGDLIKREANPNVTLEEALICFRDSSKVLSDIVREGREG